MIIKDKHKVTINIESRTCKVALNSSRMMLSGHASSSFFSLAPFYAKKSLRRRAYGCRSGRGATGREATAGASPSGPDLVQLRHGSVAEGLCGRQLQQRGGIGVLGSDGEEPAALCLATGAGAPQRQQRQGGSRRQRRARASSGYV